MSQIEITVLKQGRKSKYVISCCFFTMNDAYRNFEKYRTALKNILTSEIDPKYELRIYTDDTGKDDALELVNKYSFIQPTLLQFNCPEFRDGVGHIGTFGTLVRFLPLFEKDLTEVWITDIDIPSYYLDSKLMTKMMSSCDVFIQTNICYDRKIYARKYTIIANRIVFKVFFPKAVFTRFLNKLKDGKLHETVEKLNANTRKPYYKVPYGIDEVFMNTDIYNLLKRKDVKCCILKQYDAENFLSGTVSQKEVNLLKQNYSNPTYDTVQKVKKIYEVKLPLLIDKYPCLKDMLDNLHLFRNSFTKLSHLLSSEM